jgi:hypothetical protein
MRLINLILMSEKDQLNESDMIQHSQEWLNSHGQPSYTYLKKLADDDDPASKDELLELADQYNIPYDRSTTVNELVEKIRMFMSMGPDSA